MNHQELKNFILETYPVQARITRGSNTPIMRCFATTAIKNGLPW